VIVHPRPFRIAVALGGGGARGGAHFGVLRELTEAGICPDMIVGTSIGAIVGAAFALDPDHPELEEQVFRKLETDKLRRLQKQFEQLRREGEHPGWRERINAVVGKVRKLVLWNRQALAESIVAADPLVELIDEIVGAARFGDTQIPFYAVAFDLAASETVVVGEGDLAVALWASSAIPGIFEPVRVARRVLIDGCVLEVVPSPAARALGADFVIGVDIGSRFPDSLPRSAAAVAARVSRLRAEHIREGNARAADVLIRPDVGSVQWSDVSLSRQCFKIGRETARQVIPRARHAIRKAKIRSLPRRLFGRPGPEIEVACVEREELANPPVAKGHVRPDAPGSDMPTLSGLTSDPAQAEMAAGATAEP
jgi:NTE family protein